MEKKPSRTIIGWREVARARTGPWLPHRPPRPPAAPQPQLGIVANDPSAKDRWEGEGGQLLEPAKSRRIKSVY